MVQELDQERYFADVMPVKTNADHPWREAMVWMLLLGFFFISGYSITNRWAATHQDAVSFHMPWDVQIPFVGWMILPYLSLNLIFPCTFFLFERRHVLRQFAVRILASQVICFAVFALMPSVNVRTLPQPDGAIGKLFEQLRAFELPYNMFPSLHAATLLLVWLAWLPVLRQQRLARWSWHGWCSLILISTVTTWQHDLLDVAAGLVVGLIAMMVSGVSAGLRQFIQNADS